MTGTFRYGPLARCVSVALPLVAPLPAAAQGGPVPAPIASTTIIGVEMGEPEYEFAHILAVAFLPGDRIAASDAQSTDVRVFTLDGRHVMTLGRGGGGPGEFVAPFAISGSDSIIQVFDAMQHRVVRFSNDGEHLETSRLPAVPGHNLTQVVQLATGPVIGATTPSFSMGQTMHQPDVVVILRRPDGAVDTLARFHPGATVWYTLGARGPWSLADSRFGAAGAWAARDSIVAVADGYAGIVRFLEAGASGGLAEVSAVRLPGESRPVRDADLEEVEDSLRALYANVGRPLGRLGFEPPPRWSIAQEAFFDRDGALWVRQAIDPDYREQWTVLTPDGIRHRWLFPPRVRVTAAALPYVAVVMILDGGVQVVALYRFRVSR